MNRWLKYDDTYKYDTYKRKKGFFQKKDGKWSCWNELRIEIFERDNYTCKICGKTFDAKSLTIDHIFPVACGGNEFDENNLQTLCRECHKKKTKEDIKIINEYRKEGIKALKTKQSKLLF